jgi:hypothetical protein
MKPARANRRRLSAMWSFDSLGVQRAGRGGTWEGRRRRGVKTGWRRRGSKAKNRNKEDRE